MFDLERFRFKGVIYTGKGRFGIDGAVKRESTVMGFTKLVFMK